MKYKNNYKTSARLTLPHKGSLNSAIFVHLSELTWAQLRELVKGFSPAFKEMKTLCKLPFFFFFFKKFYKPIRIFMTADEEKFIPSA